MVVKTFRGLLADGGQDRIRLSTIKGKVGYRIVKFQTMAAVPGTTNAEDVTKIYKTKQSTPVATVNFTDTDLLACALTTASTETEDFGIAEQIIFDNEIFNQDIYVSHVDAKTGESVNYYIELEVIPLDDAGAEYTTLKDMRQS